MDTVITQCGHTTVNRSGYIPSQMMQVQVMDTIMIYFHKHTSYDTIWKQNEKCLSLQDTHVKQ